MRVILRGFLGVLGVCIALFSVICFIRGIADLMHGRITPELGLLLLLFFAGTTVAGVMLAKTNLHPNLSDAQPNDPRLSPFETEQRILALAHSTDGQLTIAEVALRFHLSIEESKAALDRLTAQGVTAPELTSQGQFVYSFTGLEPQHEEHKAAPQIEASVHSQTTLHAEESRLPSRE